MSVSTPLMAVVNKMPSYVSNKSFEMFPTVMNSLSVGVFSYCLFCESIAVQFRTFIPHGEKPLVENDSPSSRTTKSSLFRGLANFSNVTYVYLF